MTELVDRPRSDRGDHRREQLVAAGVALLAEGGLPAVTTRAVAERAGANLGLIHYHFGGVAALQTAIARRACGLVIDPVIDALVAEPDDASLLRVVAGLPVASGADNRTVELATHLVVAAAQEAAFGEVLAEALRQARARLAAWSTDHHPDWSAARCTATATLLAALIDGLLLHRMLDPALPWDAALAELGLLLRGSRP